jgi:SAM-dependent methyltransferase
MHPSVFQAFDAVCRSLAIDGSVLEIGASPDHQTLLALPSLSDAAERLGVGLDGEAEGDGYRIRRIDSHDLSVFADGTFQLVLSNSMLEHDGRFWLSLEEAKRVIAPGGHIVLGVPSFSRMGEVPGRHLIKLLSRIPLIGNQWRTARIACDASSLTLGLHEFPRDYYRFSERAMTDVLLDGLENISTRVILSPPRVIGIGRRPRTPRP